jgi:hypothetical protein
MLGKRAEARKSFVSFVKKQQEFEVGQIDKVLLDYEGTSIDGALSHAKPLVAT